MSWIRLDDQIAHHPKFIAAGPLASWLWVCGQSYCGRYLTDGFIPEAALSSLGRVPTPERYAEVLVKVGLWEPAEGGYRVHDYHEYQPAKEEVEATRERRRESGRIGGLKSGANRKAHTQAPRQANAKQSASIVLKQNGTIQEAKSNPVPDPDPDALSEHLPREGSADAFWLAWREMFRQTQAGAFLPLIPRKLDEQHLIDLVCHYPDPAYLLKMAELFLRLDVPDLRGKPRSLGMFKHYATWCDTELRKAGVLPATAVVGA